MKLDIIENHFRQQEQLFGNLADAESFTMIFALIDKARKLEAENDKLAALNRHYFFKFYDGNIEKMMKDNSYLLGD
jgi:hypothetical protein